MNYWVIAKDVSFKVTFDHQNRISTYLQPRNYSISTKFNRKCKGGWSWTSKNNHLISALNEKRRDSERYDKSFYE